MPGHTVRSDGGRMVYYLDTDGNLKSNLDAETLEDHPLALLPFRSATRQLAQQRKMGFSLLNLLTSAESMFWLRKWIHPRILTLCPSHTPRSTHFKKMVYCTSLHFLRHEQCKDGMGFRKHHVYFDEAGTSTPHWKTLRVWTNLLLRPRSSKVGDDAFSQQTKRVAVPPSYTPRSVWSTGYSVIFLTSSSAFGFYTPFFRSAFRGGHGFPFLFSFNCVLFIYFF